MKQVEWGNQLEPRELAARDAEFSRRYESLKALIKKKLGALSKYADGMALKEVVNCEDLCYL